MVEKKLFAYQRKETNRTYIYHSLFSLNSLLFLFLITNTISDNKERILTGEYSEIHLIIEGTGGEQQIINNDFAINPTAFLIEGNAITC